MIPPRIKAITVLDDFKIKILYVNGHEKLYDKIKDVLKNYLFSMFSDNFLTRP